MISTANAWQRRAQIVAAQQVTFRQYATPHGVELSGEVPTLAHAQELAAQFPKSTKARAVTLSRARDGDYRNGSEVVGLVTFSAQLDANDANKGVNEGGIKRWKTFRKHLDRLGHTVTHTMPFSNALTEEDFHKLIGHTPG